MVSRYMLPSRVKREQHIYKILYINSPIKGWYMSDSEKMASGANQLLELSERNFDDTVSGDRPVLVDFWATWCGPCQFMLPIFDKLAKKYGQKVTFGRLNVDDNQGIAMRFDVYAIPTFIVFVNGKAIDRAVGAVGEKGLEGLLQKYQ